MNTSIRTALCLGISICLFFCVAIDRSVAAEDEVIVTVGDYPLTMQDLRAYLQRRGAEGQDMLTVEQALKEMVNSNIILQEALRRKIQDRPDIKDRINSYVTNVITQQFIAEQVGTRQESVTEDYARKLYNENWKNSRYPRRIDLSRVYIKYKDSSLKETAREYTERLRANMAETQYLKTKDFLENIITVMRPPDGVSLSGNDDKDLTILSFKKYMPSYWLTASLLKEGEVGGIDVLPDNRYALYKVVAEKPKTEMPYKEVYSEIMITAGYEAYASNLNSFIDSLKPGYTITYKKNPSEIPLK